VPCAPRFAFSLVRFRTERPGDEFTRVRSFASLLQSTDQSANQGRTGDLKSVKSKIKIRTKNVSDRVPIQTAESNEQ
jgi:hypothetical protein